MSSVVVTWTPERIEEFKRMKFSAAKGSKLIDTGTPSEARQN